VPERKILGIKRPIFIAGVVLLLVLGVISFLAGALGESFFGDIGLPAWLSVDSPHPELPAEEIFSIGGLSITNTMFTAWLSILLLGGFFYAITRRIKLIPGRLQVAGEFILGWIYNLCKDAAGEKNGRRFFPIVATLFLFVLVNAWMNLIPGYGAILIRSPAARRQYRYQSAAGPGPGILRGRGVLGFQYPWGRHLSEEVL
jgi:F-type H+-transporting ATPase subunit a